MPIATQTDVEQRLQIDFTNAADPVVANLIAAAQGHIEREVGYPLESATGLIEKFDGSVSGYRISTLFVSRRPLTAIASITEDGTALAATDYLFYADGRIVRVSNGYDITWKTYKRQAIVVTFTAGYASGAVPKDLVDLCAVMAARAFQVGASFAASSPVAEGITQISLEGSDSISYSEAAGQLAIGLKTGPELDERDICHYYRTPAIA